MIFFKISLYFSIIVICLSIICSFLRVAKGPTLSDRVIALDLTAYQLIAMIILISLHTKQPMYIDISIMLALIVYLGTISFAKYIGRPINHIKGKQNDLDE